MSFSTAKYKNSEDFIETQSLLEPQQQNFEVQLHYDIVQERAERISKISHAFQTVNGLLKDLSEMVVGQEEVLGSIENNVSESAEKSKQALAELSQASKSTKSGRQRYCLVCLLVSVLLFLVSLIGVSFMKFK